MKRLFGLAVSLVLAIPVAASADGLDFGKLLGKPKLYERDESIAAFLKLKADAQLSTLFKKEAWLEAFRAYLKTEKSDENLDFVVRVEGKGDPRAIFNRFIKDGAPSQVNLPAAIRTSLLAVAKKAEKLVKGKLPTGVWETLDFTKAVKSIRALLLSDALPRFVKALLAERKAIAKTIAKGQWYNQVRILPGDVVLYVDRGWVTGVSFSQGAQRFVIPTSNFGSYKGSIYTHHAAVAAENTKGELGVAHSTGDQGVHFTVMNDRDEKGIKANPKVYGSYMVFRLKDAAVRKKWAAEVNKVAQSWTGAKSKFLGYAETKDLAAAGFHFSTYWSKAKAKAAQYVKTREDGGLAEKMYCSQLVIAIYQAAIGVVEAEQLMALHADYTSPMKLHHYLAVNKNWELVGIEKY